MSKRFAIFILSHGRADTISTYRALRGYGYTGDMFVVIDNEDDQEQEYRDKFGDDIIQFDKRDYVLKTDLGDLDDDRRIGVLARNFIQDKAKELGYKYHLQLDDDIFGFEFRYETEDGKMRCKKAKCMDKILSAYCDYMDETPITALSFSIGSYFVGGDNRMWRNKMIPKTMTTFLMRADDVRYFNMRMNDDITTSALNFSRGNMYFTIMWLMCVVAGTQAQKGGMTDIYQNAGTYRKAFYTVMSLPSCSKIFFIGPKFKRLHHQIIWENCVPKILSERYKKA